MVQKGIEMVNKHIEIFSALLFTIERKIINTVRQHFIHASTATSIGQ